MARVYLDRCEVNEGRRLEMNQRGRLVWALSCLFKWSTLNSASTTDRPLHKLWGRNWQPT